ncbi:MAG: choline dehydrogenase [Gammaproteobacteria bacterium]|nr:choline dehydrogenase [Gammaproteobacteria bacterium]
MNEFDFIIVGAGTAGCTIANRLTENGKHSVLLLEAGKKDNYFWINIPVGYLFTIANPKTDWCYKTEPEAGLNDRSLGYARGKVLGGCSSINAMIYMRGQKSDYDHWAQLGNRGWSWDEVLPVFRKSEDYQHGSDEYHGVGGELKVQERRVNWEILDAWREAARESGIPKIREFNRGDNFGSAYFQMNQNRGTRWNARKAFLDPAKKRKNLTIITEAQVEKLGFKKTLSGIRCKDLSVITRSGKETFHARKEIILSAGAIGSPQILQLSGVGPANILEQNGVKTNLNLEGVGGNLQDHLQIRTIFKVQNTVTLNQKVNSLVGLAKMGLEYFLLRQGPLTMPPSQLGAFARSSGNQNSPNIEWHVQPLSLDKFGQPLHKFDAITPAVCNLRPSSRGHVHIKSSRPEMHPKIALNYLSTEEDQLVAIEGLKFTRKIMGANALKRFGPTEWLPGIDAQSDSELLEAARNLGTTIFHPVGTCKMGSDEKAVVDDRLRVRGIQGLRVIDASIMPTITSGNTNAPTVMIAEKGAQYITKDYE